MKVLSWNCQGLGSPLTVQHLRALVARERPNLVFLMETKNQYQRVEHIKRSLKFSSMFVVNLIGTAGGLVLLWDDLVQLTIEHTSQEFIDLSCKVTRNGYKMQISFLHASTDFHERVSLWNLLYTRHGATTAPWLCIGDFNEVLYHWEKIGQRLTERFRMTAFRHFVDSCSLINIESKGCAFTWTNKRDGDDLVKKA